MRRSPIVYDTTHTQSKFWRHELLICSIITLILTFVGLIGFSIFHVIKIFDIMLCLSILIIFIRLIGSINFDTAKGYYQDRLLKISKSAGLLDIRTPRNVSDLIDNREVLDGPIFKVEFPADYTQIKVYPNGCPHPDNIYKLQHRLEEQFKMTAELIDKRDCAVYILYFEKDRGEQLFNDDYR